MIYHLLKHNLDSWRSSISSDPLRWCICNFKRTGRHSDIWNCLNQRRDHLYCLVILTVSYFLKDWLFDDWTVTNVKSSKPVDRIHDQYGGLQRLLNVTEITSWSKLNNHWKPVNTGQLFCPTQQQTFTTSIPGVEPRTFSLIRKRLTSLPLSWIQLTVISMHEVGYYLVNSQLITIRQKNHK